MAHSYNRLEKMLERQRTKSMHQYRLPIGKLSEKLIESSCDHQYTMAHSYTRLEKTLDRQQAKIMHQYSNEEAKLRNQLQKLSMEKEESKQELHKVKSAIIQAASERDLAKKAASKPALSPNRKSAATLKSALVQSHMSNDATKENKRGDVVVLKERSDARISSGPSIARNETEDNIDNFDFKDEVSQNEAEEEDDDFDINDELFQLFNWREPRKLIKTQSDFVTSSSATPPKTRQLTQTKTLMDTRATQGPKKESEDKSKPRQDLTKLASYYKYLTSDDRKQHEQATGMASKVTASMGTFQRSERRKAQQMAAVLKAEGLHPDQSSTLTPKEALDCGYLRMRRATIREMELLCQLEGIDPGIHTHMTEEDVSEYLAGKPLPGSREVYLQMPTIEEDPLLSIPTFKPPPAPLNKSAMKRDKLKASSGLAIGTRQSSILGHGAKGSSSLGLGSKGSSSLGLGVKGSSSLGLGAKGSSSLGLGAKRSSTLEFGRKGTSSMALKPKPSSTLRVPGNGHF